MFYPRSGHTKAYKNGINGFPCLALRVVGLALCLCGWCQDKWTGSTGTLHEKRRDITENIIESGVNHHTNKQSGSTVLSWLIATESSIPC